MGNGAGLVLLGVGAVVMLVAFAFIGLAIGALARLLLPGPDPMSLRATAAFGMAGSLLFGFGGRLAGLGPVAGYALALGGAMLLIWLFTRRNAPPPAA